MRITGCYRERLTNQWWNSLTPLERFNQLNSLLLTDEKKKEWSKMKWDKLGGRKRIIKGMFSGIELSSFANKITGTFKPAVERRLELCPTSSWYLMLSGRESYKNNKEKKEILGIKS